MIRVHDVHKVYETRFGHNHVLNGVGFELAMGEKLGILGRNGAGKSTLVRLISGAEHPTAGSIEREMSVSWPLAFGGAFQVSLTGRDNIRFISRIYDQDFESNLAFVESFSELGRYLREPVRTYSSGMRARLAFAISMITEFDCFLIDEVGAVGDARFHERCNYELFTKRADRAMIIISHDAAYVRDHCNRFGVLHNARLELYDDFEAAYAYFQQSIGLTKPVSIPIMHSARRTTVLDTLNRIALADDRFMLHVQQGDWARDQRQWDKAEDHYASALSLHPYERSFWSQHGHVLRAQGKLVAAEISYRTATALGMPLADLLIFLQSVMEAQAVSEEQFPIRTLKQGATSNQPPSFPDIRILGWLFWGHGEIALDEALRLMRSKPTLDDLASHMLSDPRSEHAKQALAETMSNLPDEDTESSGFTHNWLDHLHHLALPESNAEDNLVVKIDLNNSSSILSNLYDINAFFDWPKTHAAISRLLSIQSQEISESS
jgi:ABC-type polysaccharide/polyol phosphate transport system ATPase subunit